MELISRFNKGISFSLCVIDIYRKYACVIPLKDKKVITIKELLSRIKKDKSIIKKKKQYKIVLLTKCRLNSIEVFISKALTDSVISLDKLV